MDTPRPRKPWYRLRNILLLLLGILLGLVGRELYLALGATPGTSVDYPAKLVELAESVAPGAGLEGNAFPLVERALRLRDEVRDQVKSEVPDLPKAFAAEFNLLWATFDPAHPEATGNVYGDEAEFDKRRDAARRVLAGYHKIGVFRILDEVSTKPTWVRSKPSGRLLEVQLPDLAGLRDLARACGARMHLARTAGDADDFVAAFDEGMGLGRVCGTDPILISYIVGLAVRDLMLGELRDAIAAGDVPAGALDRIAGILERQTQGPPISFALRGEELGTLDTIQWSHTEGGRRIVASVWALQSPGAGIRATGSKFQNLASSIYPRGPAVRAKAEDFYTRIRAYSETPPQTRASMGWDPDTFVSSLAWNDDLLKILLPALSHAVQSDDRARTTRDGVRVLVAIERYRAAHAAPPPTLDALVPQFLPALPPDWLAASGSFRYVLIPDHSGPGLPYTLYSVGLDGKDDQGKDDMVRPSAGQPSPSPPGDLLITRPARPR